MECLLKISLITINDIISNCFDMQEVKILEDKKEEDILHIQELKKKGIYSRNRIIKK